MARPDLLFVRLGSTFGLRAAEDELEASLRRAGAEVVSARAQAPREVRTLMATDLLWARAARRAAVGALAEIDEPRAVLYSTTTAALLWPRPGAIRFDAPAAANRPGRHGLWQRPLERRRLAQAPLLVPQDAGALREAGDPAAPSVVVPIPVEPSGPPAPRDLAAVTYATNPYKKGLDRILAAWEDVDADLTVAGVEAPRGAGAAAGAGPAHEAGAAAAGAVRYAGRLDPGGFRALLRRSHVYVTAPRREDYGLAQLEALADGCRVVTTPAPGPYAALPVLREIGWVAEPGGLARAVRAALADEDPGYAGRALEAIAPFRRAAVDRVVADELLPRLLTAS